MDTTLPYNIYKITNETAAETSYYWTKNCQCHSPRIAMISNSVWIRSWIKPRIWLKVAECRTRQTRIQYWVWQNQMFLCSSTALRSGSFSEKNIEKKHLCRHDKNYYYFCKSKIPVINLTAGSRKLIKVSKNMSF